MEPTFLQLLAFMSGLLLQLWYTLNVSMFTKTDLYKLLSAFFMGGLFAFNVLEDMATKGAGNSIFNNPIVTEPLVFFLYTAVSGCVLAILFFYKRIIPTINEVSILLLTALAFYLAAQSGFNWVPLVAFGLLGAPVLVNALITTKPHQWQQFYLFVWYLCMSLFILVLHFPFPEFTHTTILTTLILVILWSLLVFRLVHSTEVRRREVYSLVVIGVIFFLIPGVVYEFATSGMHFAEVDRVWDKFFSSIDVSYLGLLTLGMMTGIVFKNLVFLGVLIPITFEDESHKVSFSRTKDYVKTMISGYDDSQLTRKQAAVFIMVISIFFISNAYIKRIPDAYLVSIVLAGVAYMNVHLFRKKKKNIEELEKDNMVRRDHA